MRAGFGHNSQFQLLGFTASYEWRISLHRLFNIAPEEVPELVPPIAGFTVWDLYFLEDLFHAENEARGLVIDVGWYPHADPAGSFRLDVLRIAPSGDHSAARHDVEWSNPISTMRSRSLLATSAEITKWLTK